MVLCCAFSIISIHYSPVVHCIGLRSFGIFTIHFSMSFVIILVLFMFRQSYCWDFLCVVSYITNRHSLVSNKFPFSLTVTHFQLCLSWNQVSFKLFKERSSHHWYDCLWSSVKSNYNLSIVVVAQKLVVTNTSLNFI